MHPYKNKNDIWTLSILILTSTLAAFLAVKNIIISSDSISYGLVSQQLIDGNGLRIPLIRFDNITPVNGSVPFAVHGLFLPILLALLGGVAPHSYLPGQVVNIICHVAISFFSFLIMKNIYRKNGFALLSGILIAFSYPILRNTHHLISETLFVSMTVASIYFFTASKNSHERLYGRNLFIAGIFASAAILTRYAGIALIAVFLGEVLLLIKSKKLKSRFKSIALASAMPVITISSLFIRNYILLGTFRGATLPPPERSLLDAFTGTIKMIFQQFQLGKHTGTIAVLFFAFLFSSIIFNKGLRDESSKFINRGIDSIILFMLSYTALIFITMAKDQPYFELRYVSPLAPFLFILTIFIIVFVWERIHFKKFSILSLFAMLLSLAIITVGTFYKSSLYLPDLLYKQERVYSILDYCTYKWLKGHYLDDIIIATNMPYRLGFFGEYSTILLPNRKWFPNAWIPDNMDYELTKRMSEVGAEVLVLFEKIDKEKFGSYLAELFDNREDTDKFVMAYDCSDGVVYNLRN